VTTFDPGLDIHCNEVVELVTAYLDGVLDEATRVAFEAHLELCEGCDVYVEQVRLAIATIGRITSETLPDEACQALVAAFRGLRAG
jgi:anti-sigma factor RsiW